MILRVYPGILGGRATRCPYFLKGVFMQELQLPTSHDWTVQDRVYGKIAMGPFEPGFEVSAPHAEKTDMVVEKDRSEAKSNGRA